MIARRGSEYPRVIAIIALSGALVAGPAALSSGETRQGAGLDSLSLDEINRLLSSQRYAEAESLIVKARVRIDAALPADSLEWARGADLLVAARLGAGRSQDPELRALAERALALRERLLGPDHLDVAKSLIRLAQLLEMSGDCAAALPLVQRGVAIRVKNLGEDHVMVARGATIEGMVHTDCGDYESARAAFARTLAIREKVLGPDHPEVAVSLTNLASVYRNLGDFAAAREALERARAIEEAQATESSSLAYILQNLSDCNYQLGKYAIARDQAERALAIRERILAPGHREIGTSLNNLGLILMATGDYAGARRTLERAVDIYKGARGEEHPDVALALGNLGAFIYWLGDYAGARALYERALAIDLKSADERSPSLANDYINLAAAMSMTGELDAALTLARRGLSLADSGYGPESPIAASAHDMVGSIHELSGRFGDAMASYERVLAIREKLYGPEHPDVARSLEMVANMARELGDDERAWRLYARAIEMRERLQGANHPALAACLANAAILRFRMGARAEALDTALRAERIGREQLRLAAQALPEREALSLAATRASTLELLVTLAAAGASGEETRRVWDALIASRALVLDEMAERLRVSRLGVHPEMAAALVEYSEASAYLAHLLTQGASSDDPKRERERVDEARARRERAERALADGSAEFRRERTGSVTTLEEVAGALPMRAALVVFARYGDPSLPAGDSRAGAASYAAFVLRSHDSDPVCVPLGPAGRIDGALGRWREEMALGALASGRTPSQAETLCRSAGEEVRRALWDPLAGAIGSAERVFVVPDGPLHLVNLAALPVDDAAYLLETGPLIHLLTTERDLASAGAAGRDGRGLLALGGASFDAPAVIAGIGGGSIPSAKGPEVALLAGHAAPATASFRGSRAQCRAFRDIRFAPLAASALEAERIVSIWEASAAGSGGERATQLLGGAAGEEALKRLAPGQRVLHIATHGFFIGASCEAAASGSRGISAVAPSSAAGPASVPVGAADPPSPRADRTPPPRETAVNSLRLSGLALAGANLRETAAADREDGILTAEEIAALDLSGVEWAVLSACDTGIGEIDSGEGVFGLRRAFRVAGARTLVMSLWSVRDELALRWMETLYGARLRESLDTAACARAASTKLLGELRDAGQSTHPFYWAGLVACGDWR